MNSRDVFDHIKLGGNFTDIPVDVFAEWLLDSSVYLTQFGLQQEAEGEMEIYDPYVAHSLEYASELICNGGMYMTGLNVLRQVVAWLWEDTHVHEYDIDYNVLETKLALVMRKLHRLVKYV